MFKKREIIQNPADTGTPDVIMMPAGQRRRFWRKFTANRLGVIGVAIIIALVGVASLANILAPYSYKEQELSAMYLPPSGKHWMGTDEFGRDVLSRVIHGSRISVYVGVVSVGLSVIIGVFIGSIAGYYGGWIDHTLTTIADLGSHHRRRGRVCDCSDWVYLLGPVCPFDTRSNSHAEKRGIR
jgi:peptide/nickel transport system permease protein